MCWKIDRSLILQEAERPLTTISTTVDAGTVRLKVDEIFPRQNRAVVGTFIYGNRSKTTVPMISRPSL